MCLLCGELYFIDQLAGWTMDTQVVIAQNIFTKVYYVILLLVFWGERGSFIVIINMHFTLSFFSSGFLVKFCSFFVHLDRGQKKGWGMKCAVTVPKTIVIGGRVVGLLLKKAWLPSGWLCVPETWVGSQVPGSCALCFSLHSFPS